MWNRQYDWKIKKSVAFEIPVISVGNLSAGGTGKTPQVAYLAQLLKESFQIGILSRGYGRRTKGYYEVEVSSTADQAGDEPLLLKTKFLSITVAVCEERAIGIPIMLLDHPHLQVILLDDAFQHRQVTPGLSILLTPYSKPFTRDFLLPAGTLRETKSGVRRADMIVVTKCPFDLTLEKRILLTNELASKSSQHVFFSYLKYEIPYLLFEPERKLDLALTEAAILFCGIADPTLLWNYLKIQIPELRLKQFSDHHHFTATDLKNIQKLAESQNGNKRQILITTEKDAMRLLPFRGFILNQQLEIYCVPVKQEFFEDDKIRFDELVKSYVQNALSQKP